MRLFVPEADHLSAQGMEVVAVNSQGFAGAWELQLIDQEDFEEIRHDFATRKIGGLDTPSVRPVIDIEIIFFERRGELIPGGRSRFSGSGHIDRVSDLPVAQLLLEVAHERIDPDALDGLCLARRQGREGDFPGRGPSRRGIQAARFAGQGPRAVDSGSTEGRLYFLSALNASSSAMWCCNAAFPEVTLYDNVVCQQRLARGMAGKLRMRNRRRQRVVMGGQELESNLTNAQLWSYFSPCLD
jgi:hypothetical protein